MQVWPGSFCTFATVAPSDTARVSCQSIYVGVGGTLAVSPDATTAATLFVVPAGYLLPVELNQGRIMATGTVTIASVVLLA
jgi:hypothetical protein